MNDHLFPLNALPFNLIDDEPPNESLIYRTLAGRGTSISDDWQGRTGNA